MSLRNTLKAQCTSSYPVYAASQLQESILLEACLDVVISIISESILLYQLTWVHSVKIV